MMEHDRKSARMKDFDYSQAGAYFVTICTQNKVCLFGDVTDGKMVLNDAGRMVEKWYRELPKKFKDIAIDEYIIMPNHIHFIIVNTGSVGADLCVCPRNTNAGEHAGSPLRKIVQWFKTMTTNEYMRNVQRNEWQPFNGKLWQRNYYEHVIRNDGDMNQIREYVAQNPMKWELDEENPKNV
jgi:putative transposase